MRTSRDPRRFLLHLGGCCIALSIGCGGAPPPAERARETRAPDYRASDYEVHEWGLLRAEAGDVLRAGAIAPTTDVRILVVLKPVLYFHTARATTLGSVTVTAGSGGSVIEAWPPVATGTSITWSSVSLDPSGACTLSPLPAPTDPFCAELPDFCETAGLAVARTDDAACVTSGGRSERFLFYRSRTTTLTPPLRFERIDAATGEARVTNDSDAPVPGTLVRVWTSALESRALVVAPPAPDASIVVPSPAAPATLDARPPSASLAEARTALRATITEIGLSTAEGDAFLRAWDPAFFPEPGLEGPQTTLTAPRESFVYFLPEAMTDEVATLALDPPPRAVRRAIAMWSTLAASGAAR